MQKTFAMLTLCAGALISGASQAGLINRGGGLIYDDILDITWLKDGNYAKSSGYNPHGFFTWSEASTWAANLSYYDSVRNVTYSDWRLPTLKPLNGSYFSGIFKYDGTADTGYNISAPGTLYEGSTASELAYMFYINLGNKAYFDTSGIIQSGYGLKNLGPFINLQASYWSGLVSGSSSSWRFVTTGGYQDQNYHLLTNSAWAVRDGDVSTIPEPDTYLLFFLGLMGIIFVSRQKS